MKKLEHAANLAIVLLAFVALAMWWRYLTPPPLPPDPDAAIYQPGDASPQLPGITFTGDHPRTLVLFINSGCKFCTANMPLYRRIREERDRRAAALQIVAVSLEPDESLTTYLAAHGMTVDRRVAAEAARVIHLRGTPTLLLLEEGRIAAKWAGQILTDQETIVLHTLFGGAVSS